MATIEIRSVIKHLVVQQKKLSEIYQELVDTYGQDAHSYSVTKYWANEWKCGRETAANVPSLGRPMEIDYSTVTPIIKKQMQEDRRISISRLADEYNLSLTTLFRIIRNDIELKKLTTKWIPHVLSEANKAKRKACCEAALSLYNKQPNAFLKSILTMDETWVYTYDPETVQEAMEWVKSKEEVSQRPRLNRNVA
ncbi:uncharacterized protein LOC107368876 [Tetranychus urticae]|uniref:uncharacterized protein LOC107368876 n=1 Tax=Tetranychus urticae TaxID=32264 RepID=UPI00077BDCDC|nr:uncharacterized protein LOC107368876 [Tetranychus urticae]